jgi:RNA polymerase sigma factor (sigma-70 family)
MPVSDEQTPDADLWRFVCQGNTQAFEVVVRRHQSLVCAVANNACGDLATSEDVAQETFWLAWRDRASLRDAGSLRAWLCGIARNLGNNARRRESRATRSVVELGRAAVVPVAAPGPAEEVVSREEEALLWRALEQVPETYRLPLILFYRHDQSVAEVAAALGLSPDAVKTRLSRGRGLLEERVAQMVEGALRRSRPGRAFAVAVLSGLTALSAGTKTALAGTGAAGSAVKAAGAGLTGGTLGAVLGPLVGLLGGWLGTWLPAQAAPTRPEREYLRRAGKRVFLVSLFLVAALTVPTVVWAGRPPLVSYPVFLGAWFALLGAYLAIDLALITRAVKRFQAAGGEPNDAPLRLRMKAIAARFRGRTFRSWATLLGLPLLDVNVSDPTPPGRPVERRVARGWIAIGDEARGVVPAIGAVARGFIAVGGRTLGVLSVGGLAVGLVAVGGCAVGVLAVGGLALGWQACGGAAVAGDVACGGAAAAWHAVFGGLAVAHDYAIGAVAWARHANDDPARAVLLNQPLPSALQWFQANPAWITPATTLAVLLACSGALLLMYRHEGKAEEG